MDRDLLVSKLTPPGVRADLLSRSQLISRLDEATTRPIVLVSAPAGFGKTTLLALWVKYSLQPVAWLSLDRDDHDPARFWRYLLTALGRAQPGMGEKALSLLNASEQPTPHAVVMALLNELAVHPAGGSAPILILDDTHLIESPAIHESLAYLLEHLPPGMHVVLSGRSDPPFPLARFRARGQLAELRLDDLRFTLEEAADLLGKVWGLDLPEESIAALVEKTEGWVTGLHLAALSLKKATDPAQFIQGFAGTHRYILDYLTEEVLAGQPDEVRTFLLETSILEQLSGPLCNAITGRSDGQEMLEALERANLFLTPLDEERRWYRYHHLFADLLLAHLQASEPTRVPELHRRAAAWFEATGMENNAIRHALAAGEAGRAARLVEGHVEELLRRGEGETLRTWLASLPEEAVRSRPRLALAQALAAFNAGRLGMAEPFLEAAEQALTGNPDEPYEPSVGKELSMLVNVPASIALLRASIEALRGNAGRTQELARVAQTQLKEAERGPSISIRWNLGLADWMSGNLAEAEHLFAGIVAEGVETNHPHLMLTGSAVLGRIQQAQGRLGTALRTYQDSLAFAARASPHLVLSAAVAHVGMAQVYYERNQLDQALSHAQEGIDLGRQLISTQALASGLAVLAWIHLAFGDPAAARRVMAEAQQVIPSPEVVALHNPAQAERARMWIDLGDLPEAELWLQDRGVDPDDEARYSRELEYLVLARVLLRKNEMDRSLALLERLAAAAKAETRTGSLISIQALQALGYQAIGREDRALSTLAQALQQAEPEGYVRTFVDEGPTMAALLHRALARGVAADYVARLLAAFPSATPAPVPLSTPLSERELEILGLLAVGASNQEIAGQLTIALTTARKHVSNILAKLGVHNRTQAVARGRELGLL